MKQDSGKKRGGRRRLIAGLRVSEADLALLAVVRPYLAESDTAGELAYRLWRRGLEVTLAELVGLGAALPAGQTEQQLALLVGRRLQLCLPLLRRTGVIARLDLASPPAPEPAPPPPPDGIDAAAAALIAGMGGGEFL